MSQCCRFLLILSSFLLCGDCMATEPLHISAGHVFVLPCALPYADDEVMSVTWTREPTGDWDAEIKVVDQSLWFFPARESHSGNYSCYFGDTDRPSAKHFSISVGELECPRATAPVFLYKSSRAQLFCHSEAMKRTMELGSVSNVSWTWMKDCSPLSRRNSDRLQFHSVSEGDAGVYTCVMNFTLNGTSYTVAKSMQVRLAAPDPVPQKPRVIKPRQETLAVKLGSKQVLNCKVFVGPGSCESDRVEPVSPYWLLNGNFVELIPDEVSVEEYCTTENSLEFRHSNLTVFNVREEFLNVPIQCVVRSSFGHDNGTVVLTPSRENELYVTLAVFAAFAVLALLLYQFRVDLALAYRSLRPCSGRQKDGKLYDAYVTHPPSEDPSSALAAAFALRILPEVLEDRFGYKLFIRERDAHPGSAVPDVVSEAVGRSRRLIVVLTPETFTNACEAKGDELLPERSSLNNNMMASEPDPNPDWGPYESRVGLYDSLVRECVQVILVQVGGDVDEALLPESLRYVKHTRGMLKWKQRYKNKPHGRFWKQMRYRMPPVREAAAGFVV